jgi:AraC-like DNA-binding protein
MREAIEINCDSAPALEEHYRRTFGPVDVRVGGAGPYGVSGCLAVLNGLSIEWMRTRGDFELQSRQGLSCIMIAFVVGGSLRVWSGDGCSDAGAGSILAVRNPTRIAFAGGSVLNIVLISAELLQRRLSVLLDRPIERKVVFSSEPGASDHPLSLLADCISDLKQSPLLSVAVAMNGRHDSISNMLADSFLLCYPNNFSGAFEASAPQIAPHHVKRALDFIHANPEQHATPAFLAGLSAVSVRSLQYSFMSVTGNTITEYQRLLRLRRAKDLVISRGDLQLKTIALSCGFNSLAAFGQSFKTAYGVTPSKLRQMHAPGAFRGVALDMATQAPDTSLCRLPQHVGPQTSRKGYRSYRGQALGSPGWQAFKGNDNE